MSPDDTIDRIDAEILDETIEAIERLKDDLLRIADHDDPEVIVAAQQEYQRKRNRILSSMGWTPAIYAAALDRRIATNFRKAS